MMYLSEGLKKLENLKLLRLDLYCNELEGSENNLKYIS